jgi:hypothetical protein
MLAADFTVTGNTLVDILLLILVILAIIWLVLAVFGRR